MIRFSNLSIQTKIITIVWLGITSAFLVVFINFIFADRNALRNSLYSELQIVARITAARSNAAVAFNDVRKANENLEVLELHDTIQAACIYNMAGNLFASYSRTTATPILCKKTIQEYTLPPASTMIVREPILNKSSALGNIVIVSDLSRITQQITRWFYLGGFMLLVASFVVLFMSRRLKISISTPLRRLTQIMAEVRETNDLTLRANIAGSDEIGQLSSNFNDMLDIIESGNAILQTVYRDLVEKSTTAEAATIELEARNQKIKELLSSAAHDLRQPLQAMAIFLDMLQLQETSPNQQKLIDKLAQAMENLRTMFVEILDVSRLEHNESELDLQKVSLVNLIEKLHLEFNIIANKKNLYLHTRVADISIFTHAGMLERVIRNLVSNAINYTHEGGILIAVRKKSQTIYIDIMDSGQGISEKNRQHIFNKFVQDDAKPKQSGSYGLGLAIVKNFIDQLGYNISVKSREGRGSCFRIEIPISALAPATNLLAPMATGEASPILTNQPLKPVTPPSHTAINQHSDSTNHALAEVKNNEYDDALLLETHVVLIDDNDEIRTDLKDFLNSMGMQVIAFAGMDDARAYFETGNYTDPDIIISDYQLGEQLTGDQVITMIREQLGVNIPAFIVTGNYSPEIAAEITAKGLEFLLKPVSIARLKAAIVAHLED